MSSTHADSAYTHLVLRNRPQLARRSGLPRHRADRNVDHLPNLGARRIPITNLVRYDLNNSHTRVVVVALVDAVAEVTEPRGGAAYVVKEDTKMRRSVLVSEQGKEPPVARRP